MLPKRSRLTKQDIQENLIRARRIQTAHFLVMYSKGLSTRNPHVSVTVSKKTAKTAVERNAIRRKVYLYIEPLLPQLNKGMKVLIKVGLEGSDNCAELNEVFNKLN